MLYAIIIRSRIDISFRSKLPGDFFGVGSRGATRYIWERVCGERCGLRTTIKVLAITGEMNGDDLLTPSLCLHTKLRDRTVHGWYTTANSCISLRIHHDGVADQQEHLRSMAPELSASLGKTGRRQCLCSRYVHWSC
jgi:hypothetical protein